MNSFPILLVGWTRGPRPPQEYVPYDVVLKHEKQCLVNHGGQSAATLRMRGGLAWSELLAVLYDVPYRAVKEAKLSEDDCRRYCKAFIKKEEKT